MTKYKRSLELLRYLETVAFFLAVISFHLVKLTTLQSSFFKIPFKVKFQCHLSPVKKTSSRSLFRKARFARNP